MKGFDGEHCETVAIGTLLAQRGSGLSEPMLFGLGEGLSFIFLNLSSMALPFVGGRTKPFEISRALCRNLGVELEVQETSSRRRAWSALRAAISAGQAVGLQLDCYHLPYFERPPHFAGHFVACIDATDDGALLVDTRAQGTHWVDRDALWAARSAKGPMSAKARSFVVRGEMPTMKAAHALTAIRGASAAYLAPPFGGASYRGIDKLARSIMQWADADMEARSLASDLMERGGTGGGLFRRFYRDFLGEVEERWGDELGRATLRHARDAFARAAKNWRTIAAIVGDASGELEDAASLCRETASVEREAMEELAQL